MNSKKSERGIEEPSSLNLASKSPKTKDEKSSNGHHFSASNQSAFRRISSIKSDPADALNEKTSKNGTSDEHLANKASIPNPFLPPLLSASSDFHSQLALLRPFLSQTLPFGPPLSSSTYWNSFPFLHPFLSGIRPPGFLSPTLSLPSLPSSSSQPKASTSTNGNPKKPSSATHYHQYTITNNNVLVPSPASLIDFIRRPGTSTRDAAHAHPTMANTKSKNLKKYKCDICSRAFSRSNTLVTHKVSRDAPILQSVVFAVRAHPPMRLSVHTAYYRPIENAEEKSIIELVPPVPC